MKNLCLLFLLALMALNVKAQHNLDSLWHVWSDTTQSDTSRLRAMSFFSWDGYASRKPDSAFYFSQLQYDLAKKIGNKEWMANALSTQGVSFIKRNDLDKAIEYLSRSLKLSEEIGNQERIADARVNLGVIYWRKGDLDQALTNFSQSLPALEAVGNRIKMATILLNMGVTLFQKGNLPQALEYLARSEKLCKEVGKKRILAKVVNIIGAIYQQQDNFPQALHYFSQSIEIMEEIGQGSAVGGALANIGTIYEQQGDTVRAIGYYTQSLKMYEEARSKRGLAGTLENLGRIFFSQGNYEEALAYNTRSLKIREEIGEKKGIASSLLSIGREDFRQGRHALAHSTFTRSLKLAQEIGDLESISNAAHTLWNSYKGTSQYRQAMEMYELYIKMRDSIKNDENTEVTLRYEFESEYEKQKALDELENKKQLEIEQEKQKNQQLLSAAIGIGMLLSLILLWVIFNRLKVSNRQKAMIEEQKRRAERSEQYKEQFLANMSHEIRTPMHAISGMVKILERNAHPDTQDAYLDAMHTSADNLLVILDDILDLSKVEAGKLEVESLPMQVAVVMENVSQLLQYKAEEKGLRLEVDIDPEVPTWIMGDPTRLNQILTNLAGNAIKFTEKGSVRLAVSRKQGFLIYEVRDTGIGISEEKLHSIFDAFEQGETSTIRNYGGTGLGLNISQQLVELQGGNIWTESEVGTGSSFYVSLPLILADETSKTSKTLSETQLQRMAAALKGSRILLAEDNAFNQMIAQDDLEYYIEDVQIDLAENGAIAFEKYLQGSYDLILMDVQMPEMDGYESTLKIREWEQANQKAPIPIIAMTASLLKLEINRSFEAGMNNYIPKPYKAEELIGRVYGEMKKPKFR